MLNFVTKRLQNKLILAFVLVLLIPTTIIGVYAVVSETNKLIDVYETDELLLVEGQASAIGLTVSRAKNALQYLAQSPVTSHYADSLTSGTGDTAYKNEFVIPLFQAFLKNSDSGIYKDVRFIDKSGQEIARVDNTAGQPTIIPDSELENKADRPYFMEAAKLHETQVYASGLDLNVDRGKIEVPYIPVIRFSTPIYAKNGSFVGVMVVKAFAAAVLAPAAPDDPAEHTLLVDSTGTYWLNPDSSKLYGALANTNASIKSDLPSDSEIILSQQNTILLGSKDRPDLAQAIVHVTLPGEMTSRWTIIHQQPLGNVFSEVNQVRSVIIGLAVASLLVAIAFALFITRGIVGPVVKLSDAAKTISQGDLNAPVPPANSGDEIGQLTSAFGNMTRDLKVSYDSLTQRATELETVATVSANAATILDADRLLQTVSELTKENFHLYHAHIYLLDETEKNLVLQAGAGEPGRIMKQQGRTIALDNLGSLVARAGRTQQGVIVNDVTQALDFLPNPLLPNTRAEMAVPMVVADTLVGVLDVQSEKVNRFAEADIQVMATLSRQIAVAVKNARAFEERQIIQRETELLYGVSRRLTAAQTRHDLLAAVTDYALSRGGSSGTLLYLDVDENGVPEWAELVAEVRQSGQGFPIGSRFKLSDFPFAQLWFSSPETPILIGDLQSDDRVDATTRAVYAQQGDRATVVLPLYLHERWVGLVTTGWAEPQTFTEQDLRIYTALGSQLVAVVDAIRSSEALEVAQYETEKRAAELETVAEVSTAATSLLSIDELLQTVVDLTKERFDLYHAHVYLVGENIDELVLASGAGEPGRIMKSEGRRIALGHPASLVARAGRTQQGVIVNDVTQASDFLPNPLLPDTRAEMAVPMVVGEKLVGVLDVQSDTAGRFTESDAQVLTTLGAQIGVALENARLYQVQVQATEELRAVDRLKSEFLASMSHELRTPLNSIIGYSRMLLDSEEENLSEDAAEDLSAIHNGGKHLLSLINDILDLAKIEANKMELDQEPVKIDSVVLEVTQMTSVLFNDKPVTLAVDIPTNLPDLWADRVRLRQVLNNLVSNAIKFTAQGEVRISAAHDAHENEITISVSDTGIGIPQEKLDAVFERFTQVDGSSARKAGGTGLGLTITRHLIDMHGGRIWAESVEGEGSTFSFTIPLVSELTMSGD